MTIPTYPYSLENILFLDIETVSCIEHYQFLSDKMKKLWDKKTTTLYLHEDKNPATLFTEKAGIYAEFGKIIVIGLGVIQRNKEGVYTLHLKYLADHDEKKLLQTFKTLVTKKSQENKLLCAHNGKEFDFPYLCRRMIIHGIALPKVLDIQNKKPWEIPHLDTMDMWKFGDRKSYTSLDLLATVFNVDSSKQIMDGSEVTYYYYTKKDIHSIGQYCVEDVRVMVQVFLTMHHLPTINTKNIVQA